MLALDRVTAGYGGGEVLHEVSLEVPANGAVALLGRNGAGKTTTLRTIMGLCRRASGSITFDGECVDGLETSERAKRGLSLVPDDRGIFASLTVLENLQIAAKAGGRWSLDDAFSIFPRLAERRANSGQALSGGEQQMLAIARALLTDPALLILDEPTEGLAPIIVEQIVDVLQDVRRRGLSILLVEQNLDVCLAVADKHYVIEDGQIVHVATSEDFAHRTDLHEKYLGVG